MIFITRLIDNSPRPAIPEVLTDAEIAERKKHRFSPSWLFARHPKEEIKRWVYGLDYGYFHRAVGGHANDGDYFSIDFYYKSKRDVLRTMSKLGIKLYKIKEGDPIIKPGVPYNSEEFHRFKNPIDDFPEYEEPGLTYISGVRCVCSIHRGEIRLSFSGHNYELSEKDFQEVKKIEQLVKSKGLANKVSRANEGRVSAISKTMYADILEG